MPPDALKQVSLKLATAMVDLYAAVKERFTVDDREHYVRSLSQQFPRRTGSLAAHVKTNAKEQK